MASPKPKLRPQDSSRIDLSRDYDVAYWISQLGITRAELELAVQEVGDRAEAVRRHLGR